MASQQTPDDIKSRVLQWLKGTRYSAASLETISGGTGNFIYRARLDKPLEDGTTDVLVKHGEPYVASNPSMALSLDRCRIEEECLTAVTSLRVNADKPSGYNYAVRTPRCLLYDDESNTQVQELLPNGANLKAYVLENYPSPTPDSLRPQCHQLGKVLAQYITKFHRRSQAEVEAWRTGPAGTPEPKLYAALKTQNQMQGLKHMINFDWLQERVAMFPGILEEAKDVFEKVKQLASEELKGAHGDLMPIHGDFWTGNILLPNSPIQEGAEIPIFVIDWEMSQLGVRNLDHGQMLCELYQLWLYKKIDAALWMVQGYAEGLGEQTEEFAFRTAIQLGVHMLSFGTIVPGWGTQDQVQDAARHGRDIIVNAWNHNREWFEKSDLACLLSRTTVGKAA